MTTRTENGRFEKGTEKLTTWACGPEKALTGWISINEIRDLWQNRKEVDVPCPIKDNQRVTVSSVRPSARFLCCAHGGFVMS